MKFVEFLNDLANDRFDPIFTRKLVTLPNPEDNFYFDIGDRWCTVEDLLASKTLEADLLRSYAIYNKEPDFGFSIGNLKAQYIPDEDFINNGSAIVIFSLVGSDWLHTVRVGDQLPMLKDSMVNDGR